MNQKLFFILCAFCFETMANGQSEINPVLKENLKGIWSSDEYRETLFRTNSKTTTLQEYTFYTDIVFDQDSTLHCNRPDFMEENYLILKSDSTVWSYFSESEMLKIVSVEKEKLIIRDHEGKNHSFTRTKTSVNQDELYSKVNEGSRAAENLWLKGSYTFKGRSQTFELVINDDGTANSDQQIETVSVFSYMNEDLLSFLYTDKSYREYVIKSYSEKEIKLQEIKELYEEGQQIRYTRKFAVLRRK